MRNRPDESDIERGKESRRANKMRLTEQDKKDIEERARERRIQNYYRNTGNPFALTDENRPYFVPLPDDWAEHKHMNVPNKNGKFPIEENLKQFLAGLEKDGFFKVWSGNPEKKKKGKQGDGWLQSNSDLFKKPDKKELDAVDKEIEADLLDDIVNES